MFTPASTPTYYVLRITNTNSTCFFKVISHHNNLIELELTTNKIQVEDQKVMVSPSERLVGGSFITALDGDKAIIDSSILPDIPTMLAQPWDGNPLVVDVVVR